jgi:hypothetical protein
MNFRGRARSRPARGKCPKALRKRRPIAAYKQFPERKRRNARARKRRRETEQTKVGGDRTHSADRTTKRHTRNGADLPRRSASKACSSSIRDRWLGPCCSVRAAAQRLRSFLGRRRRRRRRRCSADPSHGTAAYPPCSHPLKVDFHTSMVGQPFLPAFGKLLRWCTIIDRITACNMEYTAYGAPGSPVDDGVPVMGVLIKD